MDSLELLINLIIIALLVPTIVYAYRLNKNLEILRRNQKSLAQLVEALNDATYKAENSIPKLKSVTEHSSEGLKEVVDSAKELKDDCCSLMNAPTILPTVWNRLSATAARLKRRCRRQQRILRQSEKSASTKNRKKCRCPTAAPKRKWNC